jgi:hypothetical protein
MSLKSTKFTIDDDKLTDLPMDDGDAEEEEDDDKIQLLSIDEQNRQPLLYKPKGKTKSTGKTLKVNNQNYQSLKTDDDREAEMNDESDDLADDDDDDEQVIVKKSFLRRKVKGKDMKRRKEIGCHGDDDDEQVDPDDLQLPFKKGKRLRFFGMKNDQKRQLNCSIGSIGNVEHSKAATLMPKSVRTARTRLESEKSLDLGDTCLLNDLGEPSFGKIKILVPRRRQKVRFLRFKVKLCAKQCCGPLMLLTILLCAVLTLLFWKRVRLDDIVSSRIMSSWSEYTHGASVKKLLQLEKDTCDLESSDVWNVTMPQLTIESAIRVIDVNNDGVSDVIVGFGTGADMAKYPQVLCQVYFEQSKDDLRGDHLLTSSFSTQI